VTSHVVDPQQHGDDQDQHRQSSRHPRSDVQGRAERHAGNQVGRRPQYRRHDVGDHEIAPSHVHHAGHGGNGAAHRAEETPEQHALAAVLAEERLAAGDHFGVFGERPNLADTLVEHPADPKTDSIADNGTPRRPPVGRPEFQVTETDQRAQTEHDQSAGDDDADDGQGFGHRGKKNHGTHPAGMSGDPFEQVADEFGLHGGRLGGGLGNQRNRAGAPELWSRAAIYATAVCDSTIPPAAPGHKRGPGDLSPGSIPPDLGCGPMAAARCG
jgi:hypothetical protein